MNKSLAYSISAAAVVCSASLVLAAVSPPTAFPPSTDRLVLRSDECGPAVRGEQDLHSFCAEAPPMPIAPTVGTFDPARADRTHWRPLFGHQTQIVQPLTAGPPQLIVANNGIEVDRQESGVRAAEVQQTVTELRQEVETLQARAAEQATEAAEAQQTIAGLRQEVETLQARGAQQATEAAEAQQTVAGLRQEIEALNTLLTQSEDRAMSFRALLGDNDQDGVVDPRDLCSDTPAGRTVDRTGCATGDEIVLRGVGFAWNSTQLTPDSRRLLDDVAKRLNSHPDVYFEVAGHTDSTGSAESNRTLSTLRAEAVRDYLLTKGVSADRLVAVGYGEKRPVADNNDESGRALNRRVSLIRLE